MKKILTFSCVIFTMALSAQEITLEQWNEEAKTNIQMLPKYGYREKTASQKQNDENFVRQVMSQEEFKKNRTAASRHLIELGFKYLQEGDLKTAMFRFNRAYLLDSLNTDIYIGYGAVYMTLGDFENAQKQYLEGLSQNPKNTHLLNEYGTYFLGRYYESGAKDGEREAANIDTALTYFNNSYQQDPKDQNTVFKLSVCYWIKGDCSNAWKYYTECKGLGGEPITEEYTNDLKKKCKEVK